MIETDEWKGIYYAWEHTGFGFATATKSTVSEEDARAKLEAGDGKCIFVGLIDAPKVRHYEENGFWFRECVDYPGICPEFVEDKFVRGIAKGMEEEQ